MMFDLFDASHCPANTPALHMALYTDAIPLVLLSYHIIISYF